MLHDRDIFRGVGVEITLPHPDNFLKVKETLTRMGIASRKEKKLSQSCHILHKQGRYVILHFKELFHLDGKETNLEEEDLARRNTIVRLLAEWDLLKVVDPKAIVKPAAPLSQIKIVSFKEKAEWELTNKYSVGRKK